MIPKPFGLAVKAVILDDQGRCLLLRRSTTNRRFAGTWEWPGGKVDSGEDFTAALLREVLEETGLDVTLKLFVGATQYEMPSVHVVLLCFEAVVSAGEFTLSAEHDSSAWVPLNELVQQPLPEQLKLFMIEFAARKKSRI